ncbi:hypothetical protein INH39_16170 [Massilia violaceinigra]|uniref:HEPN domain-containing protein n=1 Tax=Massilia violaceinigra TaxID=2045208 RepID=A0ABY4AE36_9BURK|nr:hypothetical protein [Massilia violaceinigra]UOD33031.1 hypothetical protein INH39_16170 [Massilia violaceinigra]
MLTIADLEDLARTRLHEATALLIARQFDGAAYLSGYAVELILKARICVNLDWLGYPESRKEFENYTSLRTHDLEILLDLTGLQKNVRNKFGAHWSNVCDWSPEERYRQVGAVPEKDARTRLASASFLVRNI